VIAGIKLVGVKTKLEISGSIKVVISVAGATEVKYGAVE